MTDAAALCRQTEESVTTMEQVQTEQTPRTGETRQTQRKTRIRRSSWSVLELALFGLAALLALMMTVSGLTNLIRLFSGDREEQQTTHTVTVGGTAETTSGADSKTEQGDASADAQTPITDSALTQYANDTGYGGQIYALLDSHPEAAYVLRNLDAYPEQLLKFVVRYPQAMPFAASYLDFDRMNISQEIDLTEEGKQDTVPLLIQWDTRWGYENYGDGLLGCSGCGPTCLSMVSLYLTGWHDNDPVTIANFAQENGYYVSGSGSAWTLMSQACVNFGVVSKELPLDENKIRSALDDGKPVVCAMGPGVFTDHGHYIVIAGYDDSGYIIRDPNSPDNSARTWSFSEFKDQVRNLWSFEAA